MVQDGQIEYTNPVGGFRSEPCRSCRKLGLRKKGWSEGERGRERRGGEGNRGKQRGGREKLIWLTGSSMCKAWVLTPNAKKERRGEGRRREKEKRMPTKS